jgi:hypothetical protein
MLADDVTGVTAGADGRLEALPAWPCLRMWADAAMRVLNFDTVRDGRRRDGHSTGGTAD